MESKIKKTYLFLGLLALLLSTVFIGLTFSGFYQGYVVQNLKEEGAMLAALWEEGGRPKESFLKQAAKANPSLRITWIAENGQVLFESDKDKQQMDNHRTRPEILQAQQDGSASYGRRSVTLGQKVYYYAQRLGDGSILRVARSQSSIQGILQQLIFTVIGIFLLVFILSVLLASRLTRRILRPLRQLYEGDGDTKEVYPELLPLFNQLKAQRMETQRQLRHLEMEQDKNNLILQNMKEGLLLLSGNQQILLINKRALEIFGMPEKEYRGQNILHLTRNQSILHLLDKALEEEKGSLILEEQGIYHEYNAAPVYDKEGQKTGCLLLMADITHRQKAEKMRREFTANVSHELKTPLTSISGFAELMENGMANEEDIPHFAGKIRQEAHRLISLIEDIIKLSHLDDLEIPKQYQEVDLYEEALKVQKMLAFAAQQKGVSITVEKSSDEDTGLWADKDQMEAMIFNLLDNAIKYNTPGGTVKIHLQREKEKLQFLIADSGIGIAKEHHGRVFERFYRVDKSRSKQTGGTGLGLSIVSHIVKQHGGSLELDSAPGKGTTIHVGLPHQPPQ